jgi:uncharacterized protein YbjQ (UPF0145 family)
MNDAMTTTAFSIDGYRTVKTLGVVRGIAFRNWSIFGSIGAAIQGFVGGNVSVYTELCEKARADAFRHMVQHAEALGANGSIGVRYDATALSQGITEVLCYGTAVVVEPV